MNFCCIRKIITRNQVPHLSTHLATTTPALPLGLHLAPAEEKKKIFIIGIWKIAIILNIFFLEKQIYQGVDRETNRE